MTLINRIATTEKGWTDNVTCHQWFTKTFIPQAIARRENPEDTIVLVLDNHASHRTPEMLRSAVENNIGLHLLPPHTTHRLQPLDVGVFGPLQRKWQERCDEIISETNTEVPRSQFVKQYMDVRNEVFTPELIRSAWKKAGIWPMDPNQFTETDFAPSKLMSYTTSLPPGYPEHTDVPDMLVYTRENSESEEVGDEGTRPATQDKMYDDSDVDEEDSSDDEGIEMGEDDDEGDGIGDVITERGEDDGKDDCAADGGGMSTRREEPVTTGEVPGGATAGGTGALGDMGHSSRCESESHHSQRPIFTYPHSSTLPGAPPTSLNSHERAQISDLEEEVRSLRSQLETTNSQLEEAVAHSVCAGWEIKSLKERLNSKNSTKKRKVQVNAQYISSAEATRILDEQKREEAEKQQREAEVQATKKARDDQRKQQREAGTLTFVGSLNSKTKDDLLDITFALQLTSSDSNAAETRAALISMINGHLDKNPHLASDPAFAGLFLSRTRGRKRNDENANSAAIPPPAPFAPDFPRQPLSPNSGGNAPDPEREPSMVLFSDLPPSGFSQSTNSTPPDPNLPGPSSFMPYVHYPPRISYPTDPRFLPPLYPPPSPSHG